MDELYMYMRVAGVDAYAQRMNLRLLGVVNRAQLQAQFAQLLPCVRQICSPLLAALTAAK
eukprot:20795-Heterococcus_DN1.PRE.2